jgi:hypothetical protein
MFLNMLYYLTGVKFYDTNDYSNTAKNIKKKSRKLKKSKKKEKKKKSRKLKRNSKDRKSISVRLLEKIL